MGYYINTPEMVKEYDKAKVLVEHYNASTLPDGIEDFDFAILREDEALICVVENVLFQAAGLAYNEREMEAFKEPDSGGFQRTRTWLIMDKETAYKLSGYR